MQPSIHENFARQEKLIGSSDRAFGFVMSGAFAFLSLLTWWYGGLTWGWTGGVAIVFMASALLYPDALRPLNRLWLKFGLLLHKIANPIIMAFVYFATVVPTGLVMRALGKDLLRLRWRPEANSYWIERQPKGPTPDSMKDQF